MNIKKFERFKLVALEISMYQSSLVSVCVHQQPSQVPLAHEMQRTARRLSAMTEALSSKAMYA